MKHLNVLSGVFLFLFSAFTASAESLPCDFDSDFDKDIDGSDLYLMAETPVTGPFLAGLAENLGKPSCTPVSAYLLFEPADPRLLEVRMMNGDTVTLFGEKDPAGFVTAINAGGVWTAEHNLYMMAEFDEQYRPIEVYTNDGWAINMAWVSDDAFNYLIKSPDGVVTQGSHPPDDPMESDQMKLSANGLPLFQTMVASAARSTIRISESDPYQMQVCVGKCGVPIPVSDNPKVSVFNRRTHSFYRNTYYLDQTGCFTLPLSEIFPEAASERCEEFDTLRDQWCEEAFIRRISSVTGFQAMRSRLTDAIVRAAESLFDYHQTRSAENLCSDYASMAHKCRTGLLNAVSITPDAPETWALMFVVKWEPQFAEGPMIKSFYREGPWHTLGRLELNVAEPAECPDWVLLQKWPGPTSPSGPAIDQTIYEDTGPVVLSGTYIKAVAGTIFGEDNTGNTIRIDMGLKCCGPLNPFPGASQGGIILYIPDGGTGVYAYPPLPDGGDSYGLQCECNETNPFGACYGDDGVLVFQGGFVRVDTRDDFVGGKIQGHLEFDYCTAGYGICSELWGDFSATIEDQSSYLNYLYDTCN
jgi:hypothetical protein